MIAKLTPIVSILVIGALIAYAMSQGINGVVLAGGCTIIAALAGYVAPHRKSKE